MKRTGALIAIMAACVFADAHDTNVLPRTRLQAVETRTNTVIVRGYAEIGFVEGLRGAVLVSARESTDKLTREKALGVALTIRGKEKIEVVNVVDHDELRSLVQALDQLVAPQWGDTSMPQVEVIYTTKDGLRVASFSSRDATSVEAIIQTTYPVQTSAVLNLPQLIAFRNLIDQAQGRLDAVGRPRAQ